MSYILFFFFFSKEFCYLYATSPTHIGGRPGKFLMSVIAHVYLITSLTVAGRASLLTRSHQMFGGVQVYSCSYV